MMPPEWTNQCRAWWQELARFPWRQIIGVLRRHFRQARLGVSASSLTFTTVLALVPLFTVVLAVFSAFPVFGAFQDTIQRWLVESLVPESISRQVLGYLTQFSRKASRLGSMGLVALLVSAVVLVMTIERTLGEIWGVKKQRPLAQRLILYWTTITLGPLLLGASVVITSYLVTASRGVFGPLPGGWRWLLDSLEFVLLVVSVSGLYYYVPHTRVRWRHALTGGLLAATGIELAKKGLAAYLTSIPTYSAIYGAFAALPILLIWVYLAWLVVLFGAVVASSLPEAGLTHLRKPAGAGWPFRLALEVLSQLQAVRRQEARGLSQQALAWRLRLPAGELDAVLQGLVALDWLGILQEQGDADPRLVLLIEPAHTAAYPLIERWLLQHTPSSEGFWHAAHLKEVPLAEVLPPV